MISVIVAIVGNSGDFADNGDFDGSDICKSKLFTLVIDQM